MFLAGATPWYEGVHTYYGLAISAAFCTAWVKYIWPWMKPRVRSWQDNRLLMHGRLAVDGVAEEVPPLRRRLKRIEKRQDEFANMQQEQVTVTSRLDEGQKVIIERQNEHAERVEQIDAKVGTIIDRQDKALEMLSHLFENGQNSNNPGDLRARQAMKDGVYLTDPTVPTYDPHKDDPKP